MRIILVSGTRHARRRHRPVVAGTLVAVAGDDEVELRHGGQGDRDEDHGVDAIAADLAEKWGWRVTTIPADWDTCDHSLPQELGGCPDRPHRKRRRSGPGDYCPSADPRRNQWMVDRRPRADDVVVFPADGPVELSRSTWDLHRRAIRAGLHVHKPVPLEVSGG